MKRLIVFVFLLAAIPFLPVMANAEKSSNIYINGELWDHDDAPVLIDSNAYVSLSVIRDGLGLKADWNSAGKTVSISSNAADSITMSVKEQTSTNNASAKSDSAPPIMIGGQPYIPVKSIGSQFHIKVTWDALSRSLFLFKNTHDVQIASVSPLENEPPPPSGSEPLSQAGSAGSTTESGSAQSPTNPILADQDQMSFTGISIPTLIKQGKPALIASIQSIGDNIVIQADADMQPVAFTLPDPDRIVLDLPFAQFADRLNGQQPLQNGEIQSNHPAIDRIRYAIFSNDPATVRIVIDLNKKADYKLITDTDKHQVILTIPTKSYKVVIDPGHGGKDPGATGASKTDEKWFNLSIAQKVVADLQAEPMIDATLSRSDDTFISLDDRVNLANRLHADAFLSIHMNVYDSPDIHGTETYYARSESIKFAQTIEQQVLNASGFSDRGVRQADYYVIKYTTMPAALLEVGYISNKSDENQLLNDDFQDKIAKAIVAGIKQYLTQN